MLKKISKSKKIVILLIIVIVLLFPIIGETFAWLTKETGLLINRFSYGNIKIEIYESNMNDENINNYMIMPGNSIMKDTIITVNENSEDCWLYVKINQTDNFDDYMNYSLDDGWIKLNNEDMIFYREVDKSDIKQNFNVIKDNVINVKSDITKETLDLLVEENYPSISISAYAIQRNRNINAISSAESAWLLVDE